MVQAQQLEIKIFAEADVRVELVDFIPIFHRWIRESRLGEDVLLIDVADYRHVHNGPAIMIVGDGGQWRMDLGGGELGLLYVRKRDPIGDIGPKLVEGFRNALVACQAVEQEPSLKGAVRFRTDRARVTVMSRLAAPNTDDNAAALCGAVTDLGSTLFAGADLELARIGDERGPLSVEITGAGGVPLETLLERLA